MLVIDASAAVRACGGPNGLASYVGHELVAPPLLWPEFRAAVHQALWRRAISADHAQEHLGHLSGGAIAERNPSKLGAEAWRIADELGWAKTYDAEYVALASLLGCRLVTLDSRLRRGADRLGFVLTPAEL